MNFELTEERQMLQDSLRRFLRDQVTPESQTAATQSEAGHSPELWQGLTEMGVQGAMFSEAEGGFGGAGFDISVLFEELGRAGVAEPMLESTVLAGTLLADHPDKVEQIIGGSIFTLAHSEPTSRYDLAHVTSRAEKSGSRYRLTARKAVVGFATAASELIVSARTTGEPFDREGISLFLVPAANAQLRDYPMNGGGRAAEVALDLELPETALIGREGGAFDRLELANARATAAVCAEAVGLMETIRVLTVDYLRQRRQFGQPIGKFQALQHRMADIVIEIEQARSAVINLCGHLETDRRVRELHVSAAKNLIGRVGQLVAEEAIQMHGGIGMTQEYALGHFAKRLIMVDHRFGDADHHLERFMRWSAA